MFGINKNGTKHKIGIIMPAFFPASRITYDNTTSGLSATDAQGAIDELDSKTMKSEVVSGTTDSDGNITLNSSTWTTSSRIILHAPSANFIITPFVNSSNVWCLHATNTSGIIAASASITTRVFYFNR